MPNLRMYARGRPHSLQRLCLRVENFGLLTLPGFTLLSAPSLTRFAVVATKISSWLCFLYALNGIPKCRNSARA